MRRKDSNMASIKNFVTTFSVIMLLVATVQTISPRCPGRSQVLSRTVCRQDRDCSHGKVCCPNAYNTLSCAVPTGNDPGHSSRPSGGPGVYCLGVKCSPFEVCKPDPITKRLKCQRA